MSWKHLISPEVRQRKTERREARVELAKLREKEAKDALGVKAPPAPAVGDVVRHQKNGNAVKIDILIGNVGDETLSQLTRKKKLPGKRGERKIVDVPLITGRVGVPVFRSFTRGKSKYYPAREDRKHAKEIAGGRISRAARKLRGLRDRVLGEAGDAVQQHLPSPVEG